MLDPHCAAAESDLHPAAAHVVEHADLLGQTQRMVERRHVDHGPELQTPRALRDGGKIDVGGRRPAERRAVVLGDVVGIEAQSVQRLDDPQPRRVMPGER